MVTNHLLTGMTLQVASHGAQGILEQVHCASGALAAKAIRHVPQHRRGGFKQGSLNATHFWGKVGPPSRSLSMELCDLFEMAENQWVTGVK